MKKIRYSLIGKLMLWLLLFMGSSLGIMAQGSGDGYNPDNPSDPGDPTTMLKYKVEVVLGTPGAGTASGSGYYKYGTNVTVSASAVRGYKFAYWLKNNETEPYKTVASFSYTVGEDVKFTAIYERVKIVNAYINEEKAGNVTAVKRREVLGGEEKTINVGSASTSTTIAPFGNYYRYSTTQSIYTPGEIGCGGQITSIAFNVSSASSLSSTVQIYMGHKSTSTFSSTSDYLKASNLTLVYSKSVTIGRTVGQEVYQLDTPFEYNGEDNLVVVVTKSASSYTNGLTYKNTSCSNQCFYRQSDSTTDYASVNYSGGFRVNGSKPDITLEMNSFVYGDKEEAVLSTTANKDYLFEHWLKNNETEPYSTEPSFVYPLGDNEWEVSFTAIYKYVYNPGNPSDPGDIDRLVRHTVTVNINDERAGSVSGGGRYYVDDIAQIKTSGTVGYEFKGWLKDGQPYSTAKSFQYTVGSDDVVFTAEYVNTAEQLEEFGHAVYLVAEPMGSCTFSPESGTRYMPDDVFTVKAIPGADQEFLGWYINGVKQNMPLEFSSYMGNDDVTLVAKFVYTPDSPEDPNTPGGYEDSEGLLGDVDGDTFVNVTDVIELVNAILADKTGTLNKNRSDVNKDTLINVSDAVEIINIILKSK